MALVALDCVHDLVLALTLGHLTPQDRRVARVLLVANDLLAVVVVVVSTLEQLDVMTLMRATLSAHCACAAAAAAVHSLHHRRGCDGLFHALFGRAPASSACLLAFADVVR